MKKILGWPAVSAALLLTVCVACGGGKDAAEQNAAASGTPSAPAQYKVVKPGLGLLHKGKRFDPRAEIFTLEDTVTMECAGGAPLDYEYGPMRFLIPVAPSANNNAFGILPQNSIAIAINETMLSYTDSSLQVKIPLNKLAGYKPLKRLAGNDTTQVFIEVDRVFQNMAGEGPSKIDVGFNKLDLLVALRVQE